jgi:prepilin-type processing-associated H-X9-DG protein
LGERPNNNAGAIVTGTNGSDMLCPDDPGGSFSCAVQPQNYIAAQTKDMAAGSIPIHLEGWNYAFADGHVKWLKPISTIGKQGGTYCTSAPALAQPCGMWTEDPSDNS